MQRPNTKSNGSTQEKPGRGAPDTWTPKQKQNAIRMIKHSLHDGFFKAALLAQRETFNLKSNRDLSWTGLECGPSLAF